MGAAIARVQRTSRVLARLDVWAGLAQVAEANQYVRPDARRRLRPRAPAPHVIRCSSGSCRASSSCRTTSPFSASERVLLVTGPNMAGKSTILRQIGLVVVLAQLGGFVPAASAHVGVVDRLFTRVGAQRQPRARASPRSWWR